MRNYLAPRLLDLCAALGAVVLLAHQLAPGQVVAWGNISYPHPVGLTNAVAVAAGAYHALALQGNGSVVGWGNNSSGRATLPAGVSNVVAIAAGEEHSLALTGGQVVGWGGNQYNEATVPPGLDHVIAIAAGGQHSLALRADRRVVAWGRSSGGLTNVPPGLTNATAIAAGHDFSVALGADGRVWAWGDNDFGQTNVPDGLSNVVAIAAGYRHALAVQAAGAVVAWGIASMTNVPPSWTNVAAVAAGSDHSLALKVDGSVVAYGAGSASVVPSGLGNVIALAASWQSSLALTGAPPSFIGQQPADQLLAEGDTAMFRVLALGCQPLSYQWRANGTNLVDGGRLSGAQSPFLLLSDCRSNDAAGFSVVVSNATGSATSAVASLAFLPSLSAALGGSGLVWSTGGDAPWFVARNLIRDGRPIARSGAITNRQTSWIETTLTGPGLLSFWWKVSSEACYDFVSFCRDGVQEAAISGEVDWQQLSFYVAPGTHTVRWSYSTDDLLQLGLAAGMVDQVHFVPGEVAPVIVGQPLSRSIAPGQSADLSVRAEGATPIRYQWYKDGQPAAEATNPTLPFVSFQSGDAGVYQVVVSNDLGTVASRPATVTPTPIYVWGSNDFGQLTVPAGLTNVMAVACGSLHNVALKSDGTVCAWGFNDQGQTSVPAGLTDVVAVAASPSRFNLALRADGTVVAWGKWWDYQSSFLPATVPSGLTNVVAVSCGDEHALALKSDGTVVAWGMPFGGNTTVPWGLSNVVALGGGSFHSMALKADGSLSLWGDNQAGQVNIPANLGYVTAVACKHNYDLAMRADGTVAFWGGDCCGRANVPPDLTNAIAVAAGWHHCLALRADGTVVAWGGGGNGQATVPAGLNNVIAISGGYGHSVALLGEGPCRNQLLQNPTRTTASFSVQVPTQSGRVYALEWKTSLSDPAWQALPLVAGNGKTRTLSDTMPSASRRFYRVRAW